MENRFDDHCWKVVRKTMLEYYYVKTVREIFLCEHDSTENMNTFILAHTKASVSDLEKTKTLLMKVIEINTSSTWKVLRLSYPR